MKFFTRFKNVFNDSHIKTIQKENSWKKTFNFWVAGGALNATIALIASIMIIIVGISSYYQILIKDIEKASGVNKNDVTFTITPEGTLETNIPAYEHNIEEPTFGKLALLINPAEKSPYDIDKSIFDNTIAAFFATNELYLIEQYGDEKTVSSFPYSDFPVGTYELTQLKSQIAWSTYIPWRTLLYNTFILWSLFFSSLVIFEAILSAGLAVLFYTVFRLFQTSINYRHTYQAVLQALVPVNTILIGLGTIFNINTFWYLILMLVIFSRYYNHLVTSNTNHPKKKS